MQTIIMTVGTSLRTNKDDSLEPENKRPWVGKKIASSQQIIDMTAALSWMERTDLEFISAETNTLSHLNLSANDEIFLLHSATTAGLECAEILKVFLEKSLGQNHVVIQEIPGINYDLDESGSALEQMAELLNQIIDSARGIITLAATGGFKAQTMIIALVGSHRSIPVCYIHEEYKGLVYLPYLTSSGKTERLVRRAELPESSKPRAEIISVQADSAGHHRPKIWGKVEKMLQEIPWVEYVRFDQQAFSAPKNGVKAATRGTPDARHVFWMHLFESQQKRMAISIETTGYTPEHMTQSTIELRERLGRLI